MNVHIVIPLLVCVIIVVRLILFVPLFGNGDSALTKKTNRLWLNSTISTQILKPTECSDESRWDNAVELLKREFFSKQYSGVAHCPDGQQTKVWRQPIGSEIIGNKCEPWWRRDAISLVSSLLQPWMIGLEFGGGSSSMWLAQRIAYLHIIEGDKDWADVLTDSLSKYVYDGPNRSQVYYEDYKTQPLRYSYPILKRLGRQEAEGTFDVVVVDGRLRVMGVEQAVKMLKESGAVLILDNSNRARYKDAFRYIPKHWRRFDSVPPDQLEGLYADSPHQYFRETQNWVTRDEIITTVFLSRSIQCQFHLPQTVLRSPFNASHHPGFMSII